MPRYWLENWPASQIAAKVLKSQLPATLRKLKESSWLVFSSFPYPVMNHKSIIKTRHHMVTYGSYQSILTLFYRAVSGTFSLPFNFNLWPFNYKLMEPLKIDHHSRGVTRLFHHRRHSLGRQHPGPPWRIDRRWPSHWGKWGIALRLIAFLLGLILQI